jgi:hypothetical protein
MTDRPDVAVRLRPLKLRLRHLIRRLVCSIQREKKNHLTNTVLPDATALSVSRKPLWLERVKGIEPSS